MADAHDAAMLLPAVFAALVLSLLVVHSSRCLPRGRAVAFWISVAIYSVLRGASSRWIAPRIQHEHVPAVFGVPLLELAGWAVLIYLAWWVAARFARASTAPAGGRLFLQVVWSGVFLATASWAVETAAAAAGWWHWTPPVTTAIFGPAPAKGILEGAFVAIDFLLPFLALGAPALRGRPIRYVTLAAFPFHVVSHAAESFLGSTALLAAAHASLIALVTGLALFARTPDDAFASEDRRARWIPAASIAAVAAALALVLAGFGEHPRWALTLLPLGFATIATASLSTHVLIVVVAAGLVVVDAQLVFAMCPSLIALSFGWAGRGSPARPVFAMAAAVFLLIAIPARVAHDRRVQQEGVDGLVETRRVLAR